MCQVAVHLTFATDRGHMVTGRAPYLPRDCAGDEERRELAGAPEEVCLATKPELAAALLTRAVAGGIRAAFLAADEVYGTRHLRRTCRTVEFGYAVAVRSQPHGETLGCADERTRRSAGPPRKPIASDPHRMSD
ncbi:transposase [Streptomyces sp. NPDC058316]|uniref:transposase n=1 Tax=unclassified Streptomyces TaxID=2593676 RepID=UPI003421B42E